MLDSMARRYGRLPHELLRLSWEDLAIDTLCYLEGESQKESVIRRMEFNKSPPFAVICIE